MVAEAIQLSADTTDPLAAALLEIAELHEQLSRALSLCADNYGRYQSALHRAEAAEAKLGAEVKANQTDTEWALVINCAGKCGVPPLRIKVSPPEDAVPQWIRGFGWKVTAEDNWCQQCGEGK